MTPTLPTDVTMDDDRLLPSILLRGMDTGLKLKDAMIEAEAAERRLRDELGRAVERVEVLRERYRSNEAFVRDVWETLKAGWLARPHPAADDGGEGTTELRPRQAPELPSNNYPATGPGARLDGPFRA